MANYGMPVSWGRPPRSNTERFSPLPFFSPAPHVWSESDLFYVAVAPSGDRHDSPVAAEEGGVLHRLAAPSVLSQMKADMDLAFARWERQQARLSESCAGFGKALCEGYGRTP